METGPTHLRNREGPGPGGCQTFPPGAHGPPRASLLSLLRIFRPSSWAEPGLHGEGVSMTVKKGGGSESGSGDEVAPVATESGYAPAHTAANPAAPVYWHRQILGDWHGDRASCVLCHLIEELRVFKAELAALRKEAVKGSWRFRAEKAEAELA